MDMASLKRRAMHHNPFFPEDLPSEWAGGVTASEEWSIHGEPPFQEGREL